jgi:integrase
MALSALIVKFSDRRKRSRTDACAPAEPQEERKTMILPQPRPRRRKPLDAGPFAPEIGSFRLHLTAEGKAAKTVRTYTEAVAWFAAAHLIPRTSHAGSEQVSRHDVQRWLVHLLTRYSDVYASNQFPGAAAVLPLAGRGRAAPGSDDPAARPRVTEKLVPVFTSEEQRRDTAIIAVLTATGIRAGELAGIRYDPHDTRRSDVDLWRREITVRGKGGRPRVVRIGHKAARALDRYLRIRSRHAQAQRPHVAGGEQPGTDDRERDLPDDRPPRPSGRGRCLDAPVPAPFQPYLAGPRPGGGGPDGTQRLVLPADAAPLWRQRPQRPRPPHLRPRHDRPALTRAMTG